MKVIYKVIFPNGKIYVGQDSSDDILYFGSPARNLIEKDFTREQRRDFTIQKQILWESEIATISDINNKEREFILSNKSNDPAIGYNQRPKYNLLSWEVGEKDGNQTLREKRVGGKFQIWESDNGKFGVQEVINNKWVVRLRCAYTQDKALEVLEKLAPTVNESLSTD